MESITKNRQPYDVLRAMISRAYGPDRVPEDGDRVQELGHGWFNVAYRIRLRDGAEVVLKIAPPPQVEVMTYEHGAMGVELASLRLLAERTSVPVPRVDYADRSHELCDADYFFMPYIDADNFGVVKDSLTAAELDAYHEALGAANRELNSNVMIRDQKIVAIIDHERAFYGDSLMEAGFTATDLPAFGDPAAFLRGYGHAGLTAGERRRRRLYTLHLVLIMIIETEYRGHTDTGQYDWARERLHEAMALFGEESC